MTSLRCARPPVIEVEDASRRVAEQLADDVLAVGRRVGLAGREQHVARQIDHAHGLVAHPDAEAVSRSSASASPCAVLDRPDDDEERHDLRHQVDVDDRPQREPPLLATVAAATRLTAWTSIVGAVLDEDVERVQRMSKSYSSPLMR